jgi:hypothetical protein
MLTWKMISVLGGGAAVVALLATTGTTAQAASPVGVSTSVRGVGHLQPTAVGAMGIRTMALGTPGVLTTHYPIAPGIQVNVRSGPGTSHRIVRVLPAGTSVPINCQTPGTTETGPYGTSNIWDNIANGQFISDALVKTGSDGYIAVRCS